MKVISSVIHNRLNHPADYPTLGCDSTALYISNYVTPTVGEAQGNVYYNAYDTGAVKGLPPGPIANPSASAMLAALSPQKTNYYYFVANKGKTYFSETKAEHDAYIQSFRNSGTETNAEPQT